MENDLILNTLRRKGELRQALADLVAAAEPFNNAGKIFSDKHIYVELSGIKRPEVSALKSALERARKVMKEEA